MLKNKLFLASQYCLPQHLLSRLLGALANCRYPKLKNSLIQLAIRHYQIDMAEAASSDLNDYPHFNAFFTRHLKPGLRNWPKNNDLVTSPCDGYISQIGAIIDGTLIQAKNHPYRLVDLLTAKTTHYQQLKNAHFASLYLSPKDYHRVHMPYDGTLTDMIYIPGKLFSVGALTTATIPQLFSRNERVVCCFKTNCGPMIVVLIGAFLVASIVTTWHGAVTPCHYGHPQHWDYTTNQQHVFKRGDELGHFAFGSSVIVITPRPLDATLERSPVKLGQCVQTIQTTAHS